MSTKPETSLDPAPRGEDHGRERAPRTGWWSSTVLYWLIGLPAAVGLAVFTFASVGLPALADDAFILLVYVRHLLADKAIYWNIEEGHVDGCTSMLDMLVKAALAFVFPRADLLTLDWTSTVVMIALVAAVSLAFFARLARPNKSTSSLSIALVASLAIAGNVAVMEGASFLLETPLFVLGLFASFLPLLLVCEWTPWKLAGLGIAWALTMLSRPEAMALLALPAASLVVWHVYHAEAASRARTAKRFLLPAIIAYGFLGTYLAWHTWYFGSWAPNTYYAKHSASRLNEIQDGIAYVRAFMDTPWGYGAVLVIPLAPLLALFPAWRSKKERFFFVLLSVTALANLAIVVVSGGDCYFGLGRFLAGPSVLALLALGLAAMSLRGGARWVALLPVVLLAVGNMLVGFWNAPKKARRMAAEWPPSSGAMPCEREATLGLRTLGITSFAQTDQQRFKYVDDGLRVIDASGLNDKTAAHTKVSGHVGFGKGGVSHALRTNAEAFSYGYMFPFSPEPWARLSAREIIEDDGTRARYVGARFGEFYAEDEPGKKLSAHFRPASLRACGGWFNFWLRKDLAESMESREDVVVGPTEPQRVLPFDDPAHEVVYEGFEPTFHGPEGDVKSATGKGSVRAPAKLFHVPAEPPGACVFGVMLAPDSSPVDVSFDGDRLVQLPNANRFVLTAAHAGAAPSTSHVVSIDARNGPHARVSLKGLFVDCAAAVK